MDRDVKAKEEKIPQETKLVTENLRVLRGQWN